MSLPFEVCDRCGCLGEVVHVGSDVLCPKHTTDYDLAVEIERLRADLDRRMGKRSDCTICGEKVPFVGAVFCSEKCWRKGGSEPARKGRET